jgi:hypothetical protein
MKNDSGTAISKPIDSVLKLIFVLAIACLSWQVQAACTFFDGFKDNNDGTVTDPRNGLIWKRCAEGLEWNASTCQGSNKSMNWFEAMQTAKQNRYLGKADWRIPSKVEFEAVAGKYEDCKYNDYKSGQYSASSSIAHPVDKDNYPGRFWSSSPYVGNSSSAWLFNFHHGDSGSVTRNGYQQVRLVRAGQSSGHKAVLEFETEYAKINQYKKEIAAIYAASKTEDQAEAARFAKERAREDDRRAKEERERNANACSRLYIGKPVSYVLQGCAIYCSRSGVVTGIGRGVAGVKSSDDGVVREKDCAELN